MADVPTGPGTETRIDPLTGDEVVIVGSRQARPNLPADGCPFCPGGREAPEPYDVRWFPNRWPPLPDGRAEVVLYAPEHDVTLGSLPPDRVARLVALWAERTAALGARADVAYVLVFENRGPEVGATIAHPHGQVYAFDEVPPAVRAELGPAGEATDRPCALCTEDPGDRLVAEVGGWRAWVPAAATWPYALLLAPTDHVADLPAAAPSHDELATLLVEVFGRLDRLFDAPMPLMWWWHQRPTDGGAWPGAHLHAHVAPLLRSSGTPRFVAAGELGSGVFFNPVAPADAAAALRDA
jgi:UDPglucose--hexose-1-phosphate uridylyltransferase